VGRDLGIGASKGLFLRYESTRVREFKKGESGKGERLRKGREYDGTKSKYFGHPQLK
jgi:hypothetical protein